MIWNLPDCPWAVVRPERSFENVADRSRPLVFAGRWAMEQLALSLL